MKQTQNGQKQGSVSIQIPSVSIQIQSMARIWSLYRYRLICIDTKCSVSIQNGLYRYRFPVFSKFYIRTKYFGHLYRYRLFCIDTDVKFCQISPCFTVLVRNQPEPFPNIFIVSRDIVHDSKTLQTSFKEKKFIPQFSKFGSNSDHPKCDPMCVQNPDPSRSGLGVTYIIWILLQ